MSTSSRPRTATWYVVISSFVLIFSSFTNIIFATAYNLLTRVLNTYLLNPLRSLWSIGPSPHHAIYNGPWSWPWLHPKTFLFFAALCLGFCAKCSWVFLFAWCLDDSSLGLVWLYLAVVYAGSVQSNSIFSVRWSLWLVIVLASPISLGWRSCLATISTRSVSSRCWWRLTDAWSFSMFLCHTGERSSRCCWRALASS